MLTKREREIMEFLWNSGDAISCRDITDKFDLEAGRKGYTYALLRSLLRQGYIMNDSSQSDKLYPKTYRPRVTKAQYIINEYFGNHPDSKDINLIHCAVDKIDNIEDLKAIEVYVTSHRIKNRH